MQKRCAVFLRRYEEIARRHRHAIGHAAVESLRSRVLNLGRVRHRGDNLVGCFDREFTLNGNRCQTTAPLENQVLFADFNASNLTKRDGPPVAVS
jgi:hypothetical protein